MKIRKEKIMWFEERIADFFEKAGREHLPWRKKRMTAYEVWVSEIMLQQTQVLRVIGYYERFLKRFPTIEVLAQTSWEEFLPYYEGLGYYARGRNMLRAAQVVVKEYGGKFPRDRKLLEKIPGIGPYTAAAIMSFAYGDNHLAWDTNLRRVIGRFFFGTKKIESYVDMSSRVKSRDLGNTKEDSSTRGLTRNDKKKKESRLKTERSLDKLGMTRKDFFEQSFNLSAKTLNAALMDFGSALCVARPKCEACSLKLKCVYYKERGIQESRIKSKESRVKKKKEKCQETVAYVFLHENHKKYFSSLKSRYEPFVMPVGYDTRARIKQYFKEGYGLDVAVRPPHAKEIIRKKPAIFVNAQILLGTQAFAEFSGVEAEKWVAENRHPSVL